MKKTFRKSDLPAIEGGKPVRKNFLFFSPPSIGKEEIREVIDTLKSGWLSVGPKTKRFAKEFAAYTGSPYALATNSCTAALHLALKACGIGPGDEVITTPMTFAATANVILHCGAKPVFADIKPGYFLIDPREIEKKITRRTKAIIPVHFAGLACDMVEIMKLAKKHKLYVIEDAAHASGTEYKKRKIGTIGDFTCFSFYVTKNMTTGEGGLLTSRHAGKMAIAEKLSLHGLSLDSWHRYSKKTFRQYDLEFPGYKYNMTDVAASIGLQQLKKLERFIKLRTKLAKAYTKALSGIPEIILPKDHGLGRHTWHLYSILLRPEMMKINRDQFIEALLKENIGVSVHYRAIHRMKYYRETFKYKREDFPNASRVSETTFSLPLSCRMGMKDARDAAAAVRKIVEFYKK